MSASPERILRYFWVNPTTGTGRVEQIDVTGLAAWGANKRGEPIIDTPLLFVSLITYYNKPRLWVMRRDWAWPE